MRRFAIIPAILGITLAAVAAPTAATMLISGYDPALHDRFYSGADRAFIAEGYDLSGVGRSASGQWGTMISDSYFVSAAHWHPSGSLTFYSDNTTVSAHTYAIAGGQKIGDTDLWLGKLATPLDPAHNIAPFATEQYTSASDYTGQIIYTYGQPHIIGRNEITRVTTSVAGSSTGTAIKYYYDDPGLGIDESMLQSGDSGGPSFGVVDGQLVLWGVHWYIGSSSPYSGDTLVPYYADLLSSLMGDESLNLIIRDGGGVIGDPGDGAGGDTGGDIGGGKGKPSKPDKTDNPNKGKGRKKAAKSTRATNDVPEPTTLLLMTASAAVLLKRRWPRQCESAS